MPNQPDDKELDRLSREAADRYEIDQDTGSWDKLQQRLDIELPQKKDKRRRYIFILFLLLFIGATGTWLLTSTPGSRTETITSSKTQEQKNNEQKTSGQNTATGKTDQVEPATSNSSAAKSTAPSAGSASLPETSGQDAAGDATTKNRDADKTTVTNQSSNVRAGNNGNKDVATTRPESLSKKKASNNVNGQKNITGNRQKNTTPLVTSSKQPLMNDEARINKTADKDVVNDKAAMNDNTTASTAAASNGNVVKADSTDGSSSNKTESAAPVQDNKNDSADASVQKKKQKVPERKRPFEIGLVYSPDISTVRFTHSDKPGSNVGITLGYNFSKKWSVQTGLIYTKKNYSAYGKDYNPPKGYWTTYVDLREVNASCNMWDLPVNIRYNAIAKKNYNLFVSTGLSSYRMDREDYNYHYISMGNSQSRVRSYKTHEDYLFSILNLSLGYEHTLGKHFSVQAEPFFKAPLRGVGFGKVKMNSSGIFVGLKYRPAF